MRIRQLLTASLLATALHAGACKRAAIHTVSADAGHIGNASLKLGADAGTVIKRHERTAHEIAVDKCLNELEKAKAPEQRRRYNENEATMELMGCEGEARCQAIDYQDSSCIPFIPIYRLHELDGRFKPHSHKKH